MNFDKKINNKGQALIFWILGILIIVMLCLIFIPTIFGGGETTAKEIDKAHEQTVYDSAYLRYSSNGAFTAIYDFDNKCFVKGASAKKVKPYGESEENKGKVIMVVVTKSGKIELLWCEPKVI